MYKIIGADWKEYGPVTAEALQQWIQEGRATAQTRIQAEGTREWKRLDEFPEFASGLRNQPGAAATTPISSGLPPAVPLPAGSYSNQRVHGLAIAGLIAGILGFVQCCGPLTSTLGVVMCIAAWMQINQYPEQYRGKAAAIAGIAFAVAGFLITLVLYWSGAAAHMQRLVEELLR